MISLIGRAYETSAEGALGIRGGDPFGYGRQFKQMHSKFELVKSVVRAADESKRFAEEAEHMDAVEKAAATQTFVRAHAHRVGRGMRGMHLCAAPGRMTHP